MTLKDISSGPDWIIWVVGIILAIFSIVLLTGRGANLIAGYNAASKETIFYKGIMPSEKVLDFPVDCNTLTGSVNL